MKLPFTLIMSHLYRFNYADRLNVSLMEKSTSGTLRPGPISHFYPSALGTESQGEVVEIHPDEMGHEGLPCTDES